MDPRKRWMTLARRSRTGWDVVAPQPVGDISTLLSRLSVGAGGGAVILGADFPIGLPRAYAASRAERNFRHFLLNLPNLANFFSVCGTLDELGPDRPFYPARGIAGMTRLAHAIALGLDSATALSRACDRATVERPAGAPLFWTLGANQSGKAAISAWRNLILPAIESGTPLALWPFDGPLLSLLRPGTIALAETYPAEALRHLGLRIPGSKRRQADRQAIGGSLMAAMGRLSVVPDIAMKRDLHRGFGSDASGEDRFDSVLGALCVLNVLAGFRPDTAPEDPWVQQWEGWVLGQTALPSGWHNVPVKAISPPGEDS